MCTIKPKCSPTRQPFYETRKRKCYIRQANFAYLVEVLKVCHCLSIGVSTLEVWNLHLEYNI